MAPTNAVRAERFAFTYAGQASPMLSDVTMRVPEGAFAVVCGSTGSGKTTLLRCMTGTLAPAGERTGRMEVFGSISPQPPDVGFVMQDPESQIVCDTVLRELAFGLENLGIQPDAMRRRVAEVATVFGLGPLVDARTAELSGGQKQLVNLAAALAMRPRLLLLDEPTAQLDPIAARQLCDALRVAHGQLGVTVLVATHAPELFADMATRAFELRDGSVREVEVGLLCFEQRGSLASANVTGANGEEACARRTPSAAISLHDVWFAYDRNAPWVLKGLDAAFEEGQVSCIVGGNGCGKTTLLKVVAGVLRPQRGNVRNELRDSQAYLPQDPRLLFTADTVAEELAGCCESPGCHGDSPHGTQWGPKGAMGTVPMAPPMAPFGHLSPLDLSGGQQQMLALTKLLIASPKLLLLDEPVKGLDAESQVRLAQLLRRMAAEGSTVILATHDIAFASRVADRIALMFDGQIASDASPEEFFADAAYYAPRANAFTAAWDAACAEPTDESAHE